MCFIDYKLNNIKLTGCSGKPDFLYHGRFQNGNQIPPFDAVEPPSIL